ncbi:AAA family ATPase [Agrobacterium rubi]|nr:AAA family ATPase [Agrobacterium rubi]NTF23931.1 AAA family ATPase [Agrobacterium rubi]
MEQIIVTHGFLKKLATNIRAKYGREVRHTEILELVSDALGFKAGPLMHALKQVASEKSEPLASATRVEVSALPRGLVHHVINPQRQESIPDGALEEFLTELDRSDQIISAGLVPRHKGLFFGSSSQQLDLVEQVGRCLSRPVYSVRRDTLSTDVVQAAKDIKEIFQFAAKEPCVLFFDELELMGSDREHLSEGAAHIVSTLLVHLDDVPPHVVVIAASAHARMLDRAMLRRFHIRVDLAKKEDAFDWVAFESDDLTIAQKNLLVLATDESECVLFVRHGCRNHPEVSSARLYFRRRGVAWVREEACGRDFIDAVYQRTSRRRK